MIKLNVNHTRLTASNLDALVEGNIRSILIKMIFSSEWAHLARIAVFTNGQTKVSVSLSGDICAIPWEVLRSPGEVTVSLRGLGDSGEYVICTENESLGRVEKSNASAGVSEAEEATPDVIDSLLAGFAQVMESGGPSGADGKSVYEIAVDSGFEGTEAEWLASLKGEPGASGVYIGEDAPAVEDVNVWIKPGGEASIPATQTWVEDKIDESIVFHNFGKGYPAPYWKSVFLNRRYVVAHFLREYTTRLEAKRDNGTCYSAPIYLTTPYPMKSPVFAGTTDRNGLIIASGDRKRARSTADENDSVKFYIRLDSLRGTDYAKAVGDDITAVLRMSIFGERAVPPADPEIDYASGSTLQEALTFIEQAQAIAESYVAAETDELKPLAFTYGGNLLTSSKTLFGASTHGATGLVGGRMECDTFAQMILHGIDYANSPWHAEWTDPLDTTITFDYSGLAAYNNPNSYGWVTYLLSQITNNPYLGRDVKYDAEIAWLMWGIDETNDNIPEVCVFTDASKAYAGDFAFIQRDDQDTFDNISHIAFIGVENGERYVYEVSTETASHRNAVYKRKWDENYRKTFSYFARPNYKVLNEKGGA